MNLTVQRGRHQKLGSTAMVVITWAERLRPIPTLCSRNVTQNYAFTVEI